MRSLFILLALTSAFFLSTYAQNTSTIQGKVKFITQVPGATTALLRTSDSGMIKNLVIEQHVEHQFTRATAGSYLVWASAVGHR